MSCKYSYFDDGIFLCSLRRHKQQCILGKPDLKKCMANGYKKYKEVKFLSRRRYMVLNLVIRDVKDKKTYKAKDFDL